MLQTNVLQTKEKTYKLFILFLIRKVESSIMLRIGSAAGAEYHTDEIVKVLCQK